MLTNTSSVALITNFDRISNIPSNNQTVSLSGVCNLRMKTIKNLLKSKQQHYFKFHVSLIQLSNSETWNAPKKEQVGTIWRSKKKFQIFLKIWITCVSIIPRNGELYLWVKIPKFPTSIIELLFQCHMQYLVQFS